MKKIIRLTESDLVRLVKRVISETKPLPKRSKKMNESVLGILAIGGLALGASALYQQSKRMWSKHITGSKYKPTGIDENVYNEEKEETITIKQYRDKDGNLYWGWDHLWDPEPMDSGSTIREADLYRAIFKDQDKEKLIKFLRGIKVKTSNPNYDYLDKPKPVDMIFLKDYDKERIEHGNY
jgi:hypothetical protein